MMKKVIQCYSRSVNTGIVAMGSYAPQMTLSSERTDRVVDFLKKTRLRDEIIDYIQSEKKLPGYAYTKDDIMRRPWWEDFYKTVPEHFLKDPFRERELFTLFRPSQYDTDNTVQFERPLESFEVEMIAASLSFAGEDNELELEDIDFILVHSMPQFYLHPGNAPLVVHGMNLNLECVGYSLSNACESLYMARALAHGMINGGIFKNVLCISSCMFGSYFQDRWSNNEKSIMQIAGDGCTSLIVSAVDEPYGGFGFQGYTNGKYASAVAAVGTWDGSQQPPVHDFSMAVDVHLATEMVKESIVFDIPEVSKGVMRDGGFKEEDIKHYFGHQGFSSLKFQYAEGVGTTPDKIYTTYSKYGNVLGNTWAVSFYDALIEGQLDVGDVAMVVTLGGGKTCWGGAEVITPQLIKSIEKGTQFPGYEDKFENNGKWFVEDKK